MRSEASDRSECVNEVLAGETVEEIQLGAGTWVEVELPDGYRGWMDRRQLMPVTQLWVGHPLRLSKVSSAWSGVAGGWLPAGACVRKHEGRWFLGELPIEPQFEEPKEHEGSMVGWAQTMVGVPYHWGGRSGWGFDCSGLVSLAAALVGKKVPRDASQQFLVGEEVSASDMRTDDVVFFENENGRITHVGICDGLGKVVHASGQVRIDELHGHELRRHEDGLVSHRLAGVRRWR